MPNPFRKPSLMERLTRAREEMKEARVEASAMLAYWSNQEAYRLAEIQRLTREISALSDDEAARPFPQPGTLQAPFPPLRQDDAS